MSSSCLAGCSVHEGHEKGCFRFKWDEPRAKARYSSDPENPYYSGGPVAVGGGDIPLLAASKPISRAGKAAVMGFAEMIPAENTARFEVTAIYPFEGEAMLICANPDSFIVERVMVRDLDQLASPIPGEALKEWLEMSWDKAEVGDKIVVDIKNLAPEPRRFRAIVKGRRS